MRLNFWLLLALGLGALSPSAYAQGGNCPPEVNCHYFNGGASALHTTVVQVAATSAWTSTGVMLNAGDYVTIVAKGQASTQQSIFVGPEGWGGTTSPSHPVPDAAAWSLIAKIGSGGTPFYVGSAVTLEILTSGELYLGYNDSVFSDNTGYYVAYVTTTPMAILGVGDNPMWSGTLEAFPNPASRSTAVRLSAPSRAEYRVEAIDVSGRLVRMIEAGSYGPGEVKIEWDGLDDSGLPVAAGTYFLRVSSKDAVKVAKVTIVH